MKYLDETEEEISSRIETLLETATGFATEHFKVIATTLPLTFGFIVFLFYFTKHGFYPSFDIFQFSSLLISAFCIGAIAFTLFAVLTALPGFFIVQNFLKRPEIKKTLSKLIDGRTTTEQNKVISFSLRTAVLWPCVVNAAVTFSSVELFPDYFLWFALLSPIAVSIIFSLGLTQSLYLTWKDVVIYILASSLTLFFSTFLFLIFLKVAGSTISSLAESPFESLAMTALAIIISFLVAMTTMASLGGAKVVALASIMFSSLILFYSGAVTDLPKNVVRALGLGEYEAKAIIFTKDYCENFENTQNINFSGDCAIQNAKVIWSLGESFVISTNDRETKPIKVLLPARYIQSVIRAVDVPKR